MTKLSDNSLAIFGIIRKWKSKSRLQLNIMNDHNKAVYQACVIRWEMRVKINNNVIDNDDSIKWWNYQMIT